MIFLLHSLPDPLTPRLIVNPLWNYKPFLGTIRSTFLSLFLPILYKCSPFLVALTPLSLAGKHPLFVSISPLSWTFNPLVWSINPPSWSTKTHSCAFESLFLDLGNSFIGFINLWGYKNPFVRSCRPFWWVYETSFLVPISFVYTRNQRGQYIFFVFCRLYPSSPSHHGSFCVLSYLSSFFSGLTLYVSPVRACPNHMMGAVSLDPKRRQSWAS